MKMITLIMIFILTISGCKEEETGPTTFEGKVVYADDGNHLVSTVVTIIPWENVASPGCCQKPAKSDTLADNSSFFIEFENNSEYYRFDLFVTLNGTFDAISINDGLDCSPFDCGNLKPGKMYNDLVIKVPR